MPDFQFYYFDLGAAIIRFAQLLILAIKQRAEDVKKVLIKTKLFSQILASPLT